MIVKKEWPFLFEILRKSAFKDICGSGCPWSLGRQFLLLNDTFSSNRCFFVLIKQELVTANHEAYNLFEWKMILVSSILKLIIKIKITPILWYLLFMIHTLPFPVVLALRWNLNPLNFYLRKLWDSWLVMDIEGHAAFLLNHP